MNINTTKTVLSVKDYVDDNLKCKNSAWSYKFNSSWNECDTWCDYINYYFFSNVLAQVYIIDSDIIPKNKKLGFPLPVKTYDTDLYSKVIFNKVERTSEGVKGYLTGTDFTANQDIQNAYLSFYLNPDIKIPHEYVLNRYRAILLNPTANLPVYMMVGKFMINRNLLPNGTIKPETKINLVADRYLSAVFNFKTDEKATVIRLSVKGYLVALSDLSIYSSSGLSAYRYINPTTKLNITASPNLTTNRNIYSNDLISILSTVNLQYARCTNDIWDDWDTWNDYDNWECSNPVSISANGIVPPNIYLAFDTNRYLNIVGNIPPTSTASIVECCNCWGDFNTWEDRSTWRCN